MIPLQHQPISSQNNPSQPPRRFPGQSIITFRKSMVFIWLLLWPLLLTFYLWPIRFRGLLLCMLLAVLGLWAGGVFLVKIRWIRGIVLSLGALILLFLLWPGHPIDHSLLRNEYIRVLLGYQGVPYVWGGETRRGVDCSGLVRSGLYDANVKMGLRTFNPFLVRQGLSLWWKDSSARDLQEGCKGATYPVLSAPSLNMLDYSRVLPGDLAVLAHGAHVMAYLGGRTWIEADPGPTRQVMEVRAPSHNAWFHLPAHIMRWKQLS